MGSVRDKMVEQIRAAKRGTVIAEPVVQVEVVVEEVRARDENGHFIADDPATPENEAWTKKPVANPAKNKKTKVKKSKQVQQYCKAPEIPRYFLISWYFYLYLPHNLILYAVWMHYTQQNIYIRAFVSAMPV